MSRAKNLSSSIRLLLAGIVLAAAWLGLTLAPSPASGQVGNGTVNWNGWTLNYGVESGFDGLRLNNVRYDGTLMASQISLPVMNVYYQNNVCGPYADRLGGTIQGLYTNEFTQDGERWLEIAIEDHIGAYVIYQSYYLSENGVLDAHMFSKGLQCNVYHEHLPFWRFDFDVDGSSNDQILRRMSDGSLQAETTEFNRSATSAVNHEWYVRDTQNGTTVRLNFDDGTYNQSGTVVPETAYVENNVYGRQYRESETLWSGRPTRSLGLNEGETINDVVLWYTGYMPHSAEEGPNLWHSTGVRMQFVDDPTAPPPPPPSPECSTSLTVEAEDGDLSGAMAVAADGAASGGQYVAVPEGVGNSYSFGSPNQADYCFDITQAGSYQIETRVQGADGLSDSFFVTVDGNPAGGFLWDTSRSAGYTSDNVADRNGADPVTVNLSQGEHNITFHHREDGTRLDNITLVRLGDIGGGDGSCATSLTVEAEDGSLRGAMAVNGDTAASGGQYVGVPEGIGNAYSFGSPNQVDYCFDLAQAGRYRIETRVQGTNSLSDSFFVTVDGDPAGGFLWDTLVSSGYATDSVADRGGADPVVVDLTAGEHTITFHHREDGTRLDNITLVRLGDIGNGGGTCSTSLSVEAEDGVLRGAMAINSDAAASGGRYVGVAEDAGDAWSFGSPNQADYCFNVTQAGNYRIETRVQGPDTLSNSFYVTVDGQPTGGYLWDTALSGGSYVTNNVAQRDGASPVIVNLTTGEHTVTFHQREDGTRLDTVTLVPSG